MCARHVRVRRMLQECGNNKKVGLWEKALELSPAGRYHANNTGCEPTL